MYVLVLGLDVLGNPFGLLRGMAEGLEDLFYEPYQVYICTISFRFVRILLPSGQICRHQILNQGLS